jgi:drug/metabolite transporter (DMT)-like permease
MTFRDRLLATAVAVLWGGNFLAIHVGLQHFPPLFMAALRFAVIAVPTLLLVPRPRVPLRWLLGYGLGFGTVQFVFLFVAMDIGMPTGLASLVLQASAPFTVLLAAALLREPMSLRQGIGIGLAVIGLVAIAVARAQSAALLPVLLTLLGALGSVDVGSAPLLLQPLLDHLLDARQPRLVQRADLALQLAQQVRVAHPALRGLDQYGAGAGEVELAFLAGVHPEHAHRRGQEPAHPAGVEVVRG